MLVEVEPSVRWQDLQVADAGEEVFYQYPELEQTQRWVEEKTKKSLQVIASRGPDTPGSTAWCERMMPFSVELAAIYRYRMNMIKETKEMKEVEQEAYFDSLLTQWLRTEYRSCLTENGCEKYLQLQFPYYSMLGFDEEGSPYYMPADLRRFGDHAKSFVQADRLVGGGLYAVYQRLRERGEGGGALVMSATELYQHYGSKTDVGNAIWATERVGDEWLMQAQYWMFDAVLTDEQRRFVHNLAYLMGQGENEWQRLRALPDEDLKDAVPTDRLLFEQLPRAGNKEYQQMVEQPNTFMVPKEVLNLQQLSLLISELFESRFGMELVNDLDVQMYPVIEQMVERYLPYLKDALWHKQDEGLYYKVLRLMLYECQARYKALVARQKGLSESEVDREVYMHMQDLADGLIPVGFEMAMFGDDINGFGYQSPWQESSAWELGEAIEKYCRKHKQTYHGLNCPDCKKENSSSE